MSKMSAMVLDIQEMYYNGYSPKEISQKLNVPLDWVNTAIQDSLEEYAYDDEDYGR